MKKSTVITRAALWTLAFSLTFTLLLSVNLRAREVLPDALEYVSTGYSITFDRLETARGEIADICVFSGTNDTVCEARGTGADVGYGLLRLVRTDEYYPALHKLTFLRGGFFRSPEEHAYENVCVISDTLANVAFHSTDVLGCTVSLGGIVCRVVGVYAADDGLLARYSSDGYDVAFVPAYVMPEGTDMSVTRVYLREVPRPAEFQRDAGASPDGEASGADSEPAVTIEPSGVGYTARNALETSVGGGLYFYERNDYYDRQSLAWQSLPTLLFLCGVIVVFWLIVHLVRAVERVIAFARERVAAHLSGARADWFHVLLPVALLFAGILAVLLLVTFPPYLPDGFLPGNGHIFDLSHYVGLVVEASQRRNLSATYLYYDNYATAVLWLNGALLVACTALFAGVASSARRVLIACGVGGADARVDSG